jgi:hypothetical protein
MFPHLHRTLATLYALEKFEKGILILIFNTLVYFHSDLLSVTLVLASLRIDVIFRSN